MPQNDPGDLLSEKFRVERFLEFYPAGLSACSFANIFMWQDFFRYSFEMIAGHLCIFADHEPGVFLYLPPLGQRMDEDVFTAGLSALEERNTQKSMARIENLTGAAHLSFPREKFIRHSRDPEYIYYREDIAGLKGNRYKSQRAACRQFCRQYDHEYLPFEMSMREECLALYRAWAADRRARCGDEIYDHMLDENEKVHDRAMKHYDALGLTGRVVRVGGRIRAYTLGYPVGKKIFCVFAETADLSCRGLAAFIFQAFCADGALSPYRFINAMDSFGMPNVARTKTFFHPVFLLTSSSIRKNDENIP